MTTKNWLVLGCKGCGSVIVESVFGLPGIGLLILLLSVAVAGLISSLIAARAALRGRLLESLAVE